MGVEEINKKFCALNMSNLLDDIDDLEKRVKLRLNHGYTELIQEINQSLNRILKATLSHAEDVEQALTQEFKGLIVTATMGYKNSPGSSPNINKRKIEEKRMSFPPEKNRPFNELEYDSFESYPTNLNSFDTN